VLELAFKVSRKDDVYGDGMNVTGLSMMRIRFGMDMEQEEREHPEYSPGTEEVVESARPAVTGSHNPPFSKQTLPQGRVHIKKRL
jgi:hypothetical protein